MTLNDWFETQPRGTKTRMAEHLGISLNWLLQIKNGSKTPSVTLAREIRDYTKKKVRITDLVGE